MAATGPRPVLLSPPDVGAQERASLLEAFDSGWVGPVGPDLAAFEAETAAVVGGRHAVALSSGTAALHLALRLAGVRAGDRVLVPSFTFVASAAAVTYLGAEPVFVDSEPTTWGMDPALVAQALDARDGQAPPVAVVAVDVYGRCADYAALEPLCARAGVPLVEDAAESLGSTSGGRPAGGFGDAAVLSFNGNKIITTGGGGMLLARDAASADRARHLATQAREPVPHYEHEEVGYNYRLSNLLAAMGRAQLRGLTARVARRRRTFERYAQAFTGADGVAMMPSGPAGESNRWLSCVLLDPGGTGVTPQRLCAELAALGIEARRTWKPLHAQPVFAGARMIGGAVCEDLFARGVALPSGSAMSDEDQDRVIDAVRAVLAGARRSIGPGAPIGTGGVAA